VSPIPSSTPRSLKRSFAGRPRAAALLAICAFSAVFAGCSTTRARVDESTRQVFARNDQGADEVNYRIGPSGSDWRRVDVADGPDVAWEVGNTGVLVHVYHACGRNMDSPLPALVQQLLIGFTDREFVEEETIPFDGREARHVLVRARLDGAPVLIELFVLKKDGCVFDLSCVGAPDRVMATRAAFRTFVDGFRTERTPLARTADGR
jgi:hypothetical protein